MPDRDEYKLSDALNEKIFQERVIPYLHKEAETSKGAEANKGEVKLRPSDSPTMVLVGGQPGAGKSSSITAVQEEMQGRGGVMNIAADDLRQFHPDNAELMRKDDRTAADFTHADATRWAEKAEVYAREQRYNVLLEGTMKTPQNTAQKLAEYKQDGYATEARVVATHERSSWQGVIARYESQKAQDGSGRMTPKSVHDAAYTGVLKTVEKIETDKLADRVGVYSRGGTPIYQNSLQEGQWKHPTEMRSQLEGERNKPLTQVQWNEHIDRFDPILKNQQLRNADPQEVREVQQLQKAAISERDASVARTGPVAASSSIQPHSPAPVSTAVAQTPNDPRNPDHPGNAMYEKTRGQVVDLYAKNNLPPLTPEQLERTTAGVMTDAQNHHLKDIKELHISVDSAHKPDPKGTITAFSGDAHEVTTVRSHTNIPQAQNAPAGQTFAQQPQQAVQQPAHTNPQVQQPQQPGRQ